MSRNLILFVICAAVIGGAVYYLMQREDSRRAEFVEAMEYGARMEENLRYSEAVLAYESALDLDLEDTERAEIRFRLARSLIRGKNLNGALGVLRDLTTEDVARFDIDIGPLYLELGTAAQQMGMEPLARIAFREGGGVSPARYEEFARRLEDLSREPVIDEP